MHTSEHHIWMAKALELARQAEANGEVPVGAILVKNGEVIGQGFNQTICRHDPSAHAEIIAMREAGQLEQNYRLVDSTLYVTLEPCAMCAMAMVHARVKRVVFAAFEPRTGAGGSLYQLLQHKGHNHQVDFIEGIMQEESSALLKSFFARRRRQAKDDSNRSEIKPLKN